MTAEIGILNTTGVALAADSAVTIGHSGFQKVYNSANKLFSLSKHHPVGIMIYGSASFMGIPWEIIIKNYRKELGPATFNTLEEYKNDFVRYITSEPSMVNEYDENKQVRIIFNSYLEEILNHVDERVKELFVEERPTEAEVLELLTENAHINLEHYIKKEFLTGYSQDFIHTFIEKHKENVLNVLQNNIFINLPEELINLFTELAAHMFSKKIAADSVSGIVISGYGENEIFPCLFSFETEGLFCNTLKIDESIPTIISSKSSPDTSTSSIRAFAQKEMVQAFMHGIEPLLYSTINSGVYDVLTRVYPNVLESIGVELTPEQSEQLTSINNQIISNFVEEVSRIQDERYSNPILDIVNVLPKEELAAMAEALVNLTSFKRRVSIDAETVGGPIDVAVITKNDGLIWIKRKHYFKPELNYHFFQNYMRSDKNDGHI